MDEIILVDENDNPIGSGEKLEVHKGGKLHRAFSVFVFNKNGQVLLQRRALHKYHSAGLWTNTCCSHPRIGEEILPAGKRRLKEEMGFECELKEIFSFKYNAKLDGGLTEHEWDHVLIGRYDSDPKINPEEAEDFKWIYPEKLKEDMRLNPGNYTVWFKICLEKVLDFYKRENQREDVCRTLHIV